MRLEGEAPVYAGAAEAGIALVNEAIAFDMPRFDPLRTAILARLGRGGAARELMAGILDSWP